jgi:hypothetical protein
MKTVKLSLHRSADESFVQEWEVARECVFSVRLNQEHIDYPHDPKKLAELLFHVTNAPVEMINKTHEKILLALWENCSDGRTFYSMSVGDVVKVHDHDGNLTTLMCKSVGWEEL